MIGLERGEMERGVAMYGPVVVVLVARLVEGRKERRLAAGLLGLLWAAVGLIALQRLNAAFVWWSYADSGAMFVGMPLELLVGWAVWWGLVPQGAMGRVGVGWVVAGMAAFDVAVMPVCTGSVGLGRWWMVGEMVALGVVLTPAVLLARWTEERACLRGRAGMQVVLAGGLFLFVVPEVCFRLRPGVGWEALRSLPGWERQCGLAMVLALAVPGVSAVMEFAGRGGGTPIPYDPPVRLVTSGMYRYVRNPMQVSCVLVMLAWAGLLRNGWMLAVAGITIAYSAGIARWDEGEDLRGRFGESWVAYRQEVRNWFPRWRPGVRGSRRRCSWRGRAVCVGRCGGGSRRGGRWAWSFWMRKG